MKIDLNSDLGEGFGRWKSGDDEALMKVISSANVGGYEVTHASSHGALGDMSKRNAEYRELMLDVFAAFDKNLIVALQPNGSAMQYARKLGLRTVGKIFADRAYDDEGHLVSRKLPGAMITDLAVVVQRMDQFMND